MVIITQRYTEGKHRDTRRDGSVKLCAINSVALCVIKQPAVLLSQISTRYVTDACRKYLPFLRQSFVTKIYFFCYRSKINYVANIY